MQRLAGVTERRASFTEEKTIAALTVPVRSEGWLQYRRPGHLEKTTTAPATESLMVDGDTLSIIEGNQAHVIDLDTVPELRALVDAVRGTLSGDLAALRRSYAVTMQGDVADWRLVLTPNNPALARMVRQIVIEGAQAELRSVRTALANGDQSVMTIGPQGGPSG